MIIEELYSSLNTVEKMGLDKTVHAISVPGKGGGKFLQINGHSEPFASQEEMKQVISQTFTTIREGFEQFRTKLNEPFFYETLRKAQRIQKISLSSPDLLPWTSGINLHLDDTFDKTAIFDQSLLCSEQPQGRGPVIKEGKYFYNDSFDLTKNKVNCVRMFFATQYERLVALVGRIVRTVVRTLFSSCIRFAASYDYFTLEDQDDPERMYAHDLPKLASPHSFSSYWVGHATCLFSVPVQSVNHSGAPCSLNILTDPVEGDLATLLYPRMTKEGRALEELPPPDILLLSHNHNDHFCPESLKKLVAFQPPVIVAKGDEEKAKALGFQHVFSFDWFQKARFSFHRGDKEYCLKITTVPANHWSGSTPATLNQTLFNGYVIESDGLDGAIYFAGDTSKLDPGHIASLRDQFPIRYNFQPGGPDENRTLLEDTHQASANALDMHCKLMVEKAYSSLKNRLLRLPSWNELESEMKKCKTVYMHNKAYKLGQLHFRDSEDSYERIAAAAPLFDYPYDIDNRFNCMEVQGKTDIRDYEIEILRSMQKTAKEIKIKEGADLPQKSLSLVQLMKLLSLDAQVFIPKIGSVLDLS